MSQGVGVAGIYVHDQNEALNFYVEKLGFAVHTDARNGDYRWLTVQHPDQPSFQLGLFMPQPPTVDEATAAKLREVIGSTDPAEAAEGTVRKLYAESKGRNAIHASDSDENAAYEIAFFFASSEIVANAVRPR